jgi:hypothetical protein
MAIGTDPSGKDSLEELLKDIETLDLADVDPDALREAEDEATQWVLDRLAGKTIAKAVLEDRRIVIETQDGNRYFFYGFMGSGGRP